MVPTTGYIKHLKGHWRVPLWELVFVSCKFSLDKREAILSSGGNLCALLLDLQDKGTDRTGNRMR